MCNILNLGSMIIDNVYTVEHIVRPGETLMSKSLEVFTGGKGLNQSVALARGGAKVFHAGKCGPDGGFLVRAMRDSGVNVDYMMFSENRTGSAFLQLETSGQNCIVLYGGANREITEEEIDKVLSHFEAGDILLSQNEISCVPYLLSRAKEKGMRIALNPSPIDSVISLYPLDGVTWIFINEIEGKELSGKTDPRDICQTLLKKYPRLKIVLTLGADGVFYRDSEHEYSHPIFEIPVVDTTAAGDTFMGYFISTLVRTQSVPNALETASKASAIAVSRKGATPSIPTLQEVEAWRF